MKKKEFLARRTKLQTFTWIGLPFVAVGGWFYPLLGFLLFGCMLGAVALSFSRGRNWCDWMCPRGAFLDLTLNRITRNSSIPLFFKRNDVRTMMVLLIFAVIGTQFYLAWGNLEAMGIAMVRVLTITTLVAIVLGILIHPRVWCRICPMGTLAQWINGNKKQVHADTGCVICGICVKSCPMQLTPYEFGQGGAEEECGDCMKCGVCIVNCPKKALSFESDNTGCNCRPAA